MHVELQRIRVRGPGVECACRHDVGYQGISFPVHSQIVPCSDSSQKPSFHRQNTLRRAVNSEGLRSKWTNSLYFSLLAGNLGQRKVRARLRPPPFGLRFSLCSDRCVRNPVLRPQLLRIPFVCLFSFQFHSAKDITWPSYSIPCPPSLRPWKRLGATGSRQSRAVEPG